MVGQDLISELRVRPERINNSKNSPHSTDTQVCAVNKRAAMAPA